MRLIAIPKMIVNQYKDFPQKQFYFLLSWLIRTILSNAKVIIFAYVTNTLQ